MSPMGGPAPGGMGMGFAQVGSEVEDADDIVAQHDTLLAQLSVVLANMPREDKERMDTLLAQVSLGDDEQNNLAQTDIDAEDEGLQTLANMLAQLNEADLEQITDNILAQTDA